jgi:serine/threonine-protein kinase
MQLDRYELLAPIGFGGMAHVWAARQRAALGFTKIVAVKVIRPEYASHPEFRAMFLEEARLAACLRHTNVVEVLDLGEHDETLYQVMTLVEGASLSRVVACAARHGRAALPIGVAARILCDVLRGLEAAHGLEDDDGRPQVVIHRDVSPQNILVGVDGVAKIADFGIAKALDQGEAKTRPGLRKGKVGYMAPEIVTDGCYSRESDVFAAGVVLWEAWTGARLYPSDGRDRRRIDPLARLDGVPAPLRAVLARALAEDPRRRYPSAGSMVGELEEAARASRVLATHSDVSAIIESAAGEHVATMRALLRGTRPSPDVSSLVGSTSCSVVFTTVDPPPPARPRHMPRAAALAVLAALGAAAFIGAKSPTAGAYRGEPAAPAVSQAPLARRAATTSTAIAGSTSTATAKATATASASPPRARAAGARAAVRPLAESPSRKSTAPPDALRLPFESPYE